MSALLSSLSIIVGIAGILTHQWITVFPALGVGYLYHIRWVNWCFRIVTVALSLGAYALNPSIEQIIVLGVALFLTTVAGFSRANRLLVALDRPRHLPASKVELGDNAPVLGLVYNDKSCTWPLAILVPHHLVNDWIGGEPILAGW